MTDATGLLYSQIGFDIGDPMRAVVRAPRPDFSGITHLLSRPLPPMTPPGFSPMKIGSPTPPAGSAPWLASASATSSSPDFNP